MSFTKYTSNHIYGLIITYLCLKVNRFLFLERVIIALSHIYADVALLSSALERTRKALCALKIASQCPKIEPR